MRWIAPAACLFLSLAAATAGGARTGAPCPVTLANQLASTRSATQLVTVVAPRGTSTQGSLRMWRKAGGCWHAVAGPWTAWLGQHGVSDHKREGDRTTPAGAFGFLPVMYGIASDPGVRYRYHRIVCGDWWVEDPRSPWYNRFRHVRCGTDPPFRVTSEDMSRSPTAYRHLAVITYNRSPVVPGRGSGIFLHASTGRPTLGCVSLPLPRLLTLLHWLRPSAAPLIAIGTKAGIRRFLMSHEAVFSRIYRGAEWMTADSRSGPGSELARTADLRRELPLLLAELGVDVLLDAGCGDFRWLGEADLPVRHYIGVEVVPELAAELARNYARPGRRFLHADITRDNLPPADLVLCRDVLVHFPDDDVDRAFAAFRRTGARWLLATTFTDRATNGAIELGGWRTLNLEAPPWNFPPPVRTLLDIPIIDRELYLDKRLALWERGDFF